MARVGPDEGTVGLVAVPQDGPLGVLRGPANYVAIHTNRYAETGLVVSGPGAGPEFTAAGVLEDIINIRMTNLKPQVPMVSTGGTAIPALTMKFGGTSVGSAEAFTQAADVVLEQAQQWDRLTVVVSAMSGVTDALIESAQAAASGDDQSSRGVVADLRARHHRVVDALLLPERCGEPVEEPSQGGEHAQLQAAVDEYMDELADLCRSVHVLGEVTPRAMDAITSLGERLSARILAALLRRRGARSEAVDATDLVVTDDTFQNAAPLMDGTRTRVSTRLIPLLDEGTIPVVTGFFGATKGGVTTTLGRGGSDYSAAILGDCLDADEVWIWTDVDGVMSADPRIVPDAHVIPVLSYSEVSELAYFGAKVLHPRTIRPVVERGIPLWVKNTFNPTHPGTRIARDPESASGTVKAVTAIKGLSMVTVEGRGMMGVPGIAARTFSAVASRGASVLMISQASSEQSICFVIPTETVPPVIRAIEEEMDLELSRRDIDRVWSVDDVEIVTAVGAGMRGTPGVAARIFGALGHGDINVIAIAQGSSECSISLVVAADDAADAVRQIHDEVILNAGS
jgi:aspartate kinase